MVPRLSAEPGKFVAQRYFCRPGGMSANAALAAQRLRGPQSPTVMLASPMGDDPTGQSLQAALRGAGIRLLDSCIVTGARTSVSAVLVDAEGERQGHNVRGDAQHRCGLPQAGWLQGVQALQVDPRWPEGATAALTLARERGILSMLDGDVAPPAVLQALAPLADWAVFSSDGLLAWAADGSAADATPLRNLAEAVPAAFSRVCAALPDTQLVVTRGADGLLWRPPGQPVRALPAHAVTAVNTNGAGDALHGALLLALAEGQTPERALRFAVAAAACSVTGQPHGRPEVLALMG